MTPKVSLQSHSNTHNRWKPAYSYQRWSGHQISVDTVTAVFQGGPSGQTNLDCFLETTELWLVIRYLQISFYKTQVFGCPPQIWVDQGRIDYWIKKTRMIFSRSIYWNAYISDWYVSWARKTRLKFIDRQIRRGKKCLDTPRCLDVRPELGGSRKVMIRVWLRNWWH